MHHLKLIWVFVRIAVMNELAYQGNFFVQALQSLVGLATGLIGLAVVFRHTNALGTWRANDLIALLGVYTLVQGIIGVVIQPSLERFISEVKDGTLDFTLTKPVDAQFLVSFKEVQIWKVFDIVLGLILIVAAMVRMGAEISGPALAGFLVALLAGSLIVYSFFIVLATTVFWFIKVENILVIFQSMYVAGRWPIGIYPRWLKYALTFLVPVAFAVTVPTETLVGRLDAMTLLGAVGLAAVGVGFSRWFWLFGVKSYTGASA